MTKKLTVVISEDPDDASQGHKIEAGLMGYLAASPQLDVKLIPHLYDLAADGPSFKQLRSISGDMIVLAWLFPRAIFWLLDANRVKGRMGATSCFPEEELAPPPSTKRKKRTDAIPDRTIWCIDCRGYEGPEPLLAEIARITLEATAVPVALPSVPAIAVAGGHSRIHEGTRRRWYPVIDCDRCGHCLECLNFCLFGVFGVDDSGRLFVEQPDACRDGCPACSRVCPAGAIMFPEHNNPAIAGSAETAAGSSSGEPPPFFGTSAAAAAAAAEQHAARQKAAAEKPPGGQPKPQEPSKKSDLDRLVDELDQSDL